MVTSGERPDYTADQVLASWLQSMDLVTSWPSVYDVRDFWRSFIKLYDQELEMV